METIQFCSLKGACDKARFPPTFNIPVPVNLGIGHLPESLSVERRKSFTPTPGAQAEDQANAVKADAQNRRVAACFQILLCLLHFTTD